MHRQRRARGGRGAGEGRARGGRLGALGDSGVNHNVGHRKVDVCEEEEEAGERGADGRGGERGQHAESEETEHTGDELARAGQRTVVASDAGSELRGARSRGGLRWEERAGRRCIC